MKRQSESTAYDRWLRFRDSIESEIEAKRPKESHWERESEVPAFHRKRVSRASTNPRL